MKKIVIHITIVLLLCPVLGFAQVIDTSQRINTWKLMHNYSRFEDVSLDTFIYDTYQGSNPLNRNGAAFEYLGNLGSAAQDIYFFDRPSMRNFLFGNSMYPYMANPDRTIFYNTKSPYTEITYSIIPGSQTGAESLRFIHTQNMSQYSNIGGDFEVLSGKEYYKNEATRVTKFTLFGSRARNKYSAFGTFHFNKFNVKENGGLVDADAFKEIRMRYPAEYSMNLGKASSNYSNLQLFYTQKFAISEKVSTTDTLGVTTVTGKNISFNHQFYAERNVRMYIDENAPSSLSDIYQNYYYLDSDFQDSSSLDRISNTFQFILGDPYTDKLSARVYAGHELERYGQRSPEYYSVFSRFDTLSYDPLVLDTVFRDSAGYDFNRKFFNEIFIGFHIAGPPERPWYWNIDGKYYLAGYYQNNFQVNATFSRQVFKNYRLGLRGNIENRNVSYFHNHYSSAFFRWDNDFSASQLMRGEAFLNSEEKKFDAVFSLGMLTNYIYWDENALPAQHDRIIYIASAKVFKHIKLGGFNSRNNILVQLVSDDAVLRLPLVALKTTNYWEQDLFKGALKAQLGFNLYITSKYTGNAYMPATGVFYLQNEETVGEYPFLDAFLGLRIKRTRLFFSYNNGLGGIINYNYFTVANYPTRSAFLRFGVSWTFYD